VPQSPVDHYAYAFGKPTASGILKAKPEDFVVEEDLGCEPDGEGEHAWLWLEKRLTNTEELAQQLCRLAGVKQVDVGYAGMKDRNAVTRQWFSVNLSGKDEPDWRQLESENVCVLKTIRSRRKIKRGTLKGNRFVVRVTELNGDRVELESRLEKIAAEGVPNYFGAQRFGRDNLSKASAMFAGKIKIKNRHKRGLYLSAARSEIFNQVLSNRVSGNVWNCALAGDVMMLDGSHSIFSVDSVDDEIEKRLNEKDIHITGPLWGRGISPVPGVALQYENNVKEQYTDWCEGLEYAGLKQERRSLRLCPKQLGWCFGDDSSLELRFWLPAGAYATVILRELFGAIEPGI
jgi:tRNA pseudouridine13 synthase